MIENIKKFSAIVHNELELEKKLQTNKPLRIKYGIDPTAPNVHLGHTVPLRLLRSFQQLGHTAVIIIGNATAKVGDPSGRDETRANKTTEQIKDNVKNYLDQIGKIIDIDKAEINYNDNWFGDMSFDLVLSLLSKFTVQQILTRDDFSKRMSSNIPISMHELLYPIMQGYDSVMVDADVEIGGTEQLFNMNMGRDLQRMWNKQPQIVITLPILRGTDGTKRMGKSLENYIGISELPFEIYSKVMSIPDDLMREWFSLLTDNCKDAIDSFFSEYKPRDVKKILAKQIVSQFYDENAGLMAEKSWILQFTNKTIPDIIEEVYLKKSEVENVNIVNLLRIMGFASSNNESRRLIEQNSVSVFSTEFEKVSVEKINVCFLPVDGTVYKVGRKIRKLKLIL